MNTDATEETRLVVEAERELVREFAALPAQHVKRTVARAWARYTTANIRDFVPLLVRREARDRLCAEMHQPATEVQD